LVNFHCNFIDVWCRRCMEVLHKPKKHLTSHWSRMQASSDDFGCDILLCLNCPIACYHSQGLASDNLALGCR
jgi:hypothetical protein